MLSSLKQFASSWVSQLLLLLLVLSFAVWGIADIFTGFGSGAVATVGKSEVTLAKFQRRYGESLQILQQRFGTALTPQQAAQFGIPSQVLSVLIAEATLDNEGQDMGLGLSDETLSRLITTDPQLIGPSGVYSENYLRQVVSQQGYNLDDFVLSRREQYVRDQITDALAGGLDVPETYMRAFTEFSDEQRTIQYALVTPVPQSAIADPSDTELNAYFADNGDQWRAPELRTFRYAVLSREAIAQPADVAESEVEKRYQEQIARFTTPETRTIQQIVFDTDEAAGAAAAALSSGTSFVALGAENGLAESELDFGTFAQADIADEAIADAAFGLELGATSGVIEGRFGPVIVAVTDIVAGSVRSLDDVRASLREEIAISLAAGEVDDLHDSIEDARAGGASIADVASQFGLAVETVAGIDAQGNDVDGTAHGPFPAPDIVESVFASDIGIENDPLRVGGTFIWYEVSAVTAPRDRTLDEVRSAVVSAWKDAERERQADEQAQAILARVEGGELLDGVVADQAITVATAEGVTRGGTPPADLSPEARTAAFAGPRGHTAVVTGSDPLTRAVLVVTDVQAPAFFSGAPALEPIQAQLSRQIAVDLVQLYVTEAQNDLDIRFNQNALDQIAAGAPTARVQ